MRVAIAGASGLIGQAFVDLLQKSGHEPIVFARPNSRPVNLPTISWNPAREELSKADLESVGHIDTVVNLAGAGIGDRRWNARRKAELLNSRTSSTSLLVKHLGEFHGTSPHLINASAIGFYGSRADEVLTEDSTSGSGVLADICVAWEKAATFEGVNSAYLRTGIVMSKQGGALAKQLPLFKVGLGGQLGTGRQWVSPISLDDQLRAMMFILENKLTGPFNLVSPSPVTNREFTKTLGSVLHRPTFASAPASALKIVLGAEMASELLLISQRVLPKRLQEAGFTFEHEDLRTLLEWAVRN